MKKLLFLLMILIIPGICLADASSTITTTPVFQGQTIAASGTLTKHFRWGPNRPNGNISYNITLAGSGTARIYFECSNVGSSNYGEGGAYAVPVGYSDIVTALTAGTAFYEVQAPVSEYFKMVITETGGADSITVTVDGLTIQ